MSAMVTATPLIRVARRIHLPAELTKDPFVVCAAVLATSPLDSVIVSLTAARLHGLWLPPNISTAIHLATARSDVVSRQMTRSRRPELVSHRFQLRPVDVVRLNGLPVTSLARTFRDLAMLLALPDLVAAGDSALRAGATVEELLDAIEHNPVGRGCSRARTAVGLLDARSRSRPESHLRLAASGPRLPRFEVNVAVYRDEGGWLAEPDLSLAAAKIALEYQGADHAGVERKRRDITRSTDMRQEHWLVIEYGPAQVFGRPWQIAPELEQHIAERAPGLLR